MPSHLSGSIPGTLLPRVSLEKECGFRSRFDRCHIKNWRTRLMARHSSNSGYPNRYWERRKKITVALIWLPYQLKIKFKAICISGCGNCVFIVVLYLLTVCRNLNFYHSWRERKGHGAYITADWLEEPSGAVATSIEFGPPEMAKRTLPINLAMCSRIFSRLWRGPQLWSCVKTVFINNSPLSISFMGMSRQSSRYIKQFSLIFKSNFIFVV